MQPESRERERERKRKKNVGEGVRRGADYRHNRKLNDVKLLHVLAGKRSSMWRSVTLFMCAVSFIHPSPFVSCLPLAV